MTTISAVIVEDQKANRDHLLFLLRKFFPQIDVVATAENGARGLQAILDHSPQVVFLDVEMPVMNGLDMLKLIANPTFEVIFTTAFDKYAINAIKFSALDYLLKPIVKEDLEGAIQRLKQKQATSLASAPRIRNVLENFEATYERHFKIVVSTTEGMTFLQVENIVRCEADDNYTWLHLLKKRPILSSKTLREYEEMLSGFDFIRVHKSHLINPVHIKLVADRSVLMQDGSEVEISRRKFPEVKKLLMAS